jgi:hypothetical protein
MGEVGGRNFSRKLALVSAAHRRAGPFTAALALSLAPVRAHHIAAGARR